MRNIASIGTLFCLDQLPTATTERVRSALEKSGLDPDLARDLAKRHCFTRAKNCMRADGLIDEVGETDIRWIWQLSRRYREQNRLGYEYEASFWYEKWTESVGAHNGRINGVLGAIAKTVYEGELPPVNSPRVRAAEIMLDGNNAIEIPVERLAAVS